MSFLNLLLFSGGESVAVIKPQTGWPTCAAPRTGRSHRGERRGRKQRYAQESSTSFSHWAYSHCFQLAFQSGRHTRSIFEKEPLNRQLSSDLGSVCFGIEFAQVNFLVTLRGSLWEKKLMNTLARSTSDLSGRQERTWIFFLMRSRWVFIKWCNIIKWT